MTNTIWSNPVSGDWTDVADWSAGVPSSSKNAVVNASGTYTIAVSSADTAHSLIVDDAGATLMENSGGRLALAGGLTLDAGTVILDGANNAFGGDTRLIGGTLELGTPKALGNSDLTIDGGALIGMASENISTAVNAGGTFTLAAADGDTVRLMGNTALNMNGGGAINFGQTGDDGVFVWKPLTLGVADGGAGFSVNINDGTLVDGNGSLGEILSAAQFVNIAAGASLGIHGYSETITTLEGGGIVLSVAGGGALTVGNGNFAGTITNEISLTVGGTLTLSGANTYTGGTTINDGATLVIAQNGSFVGNVVDNGELFFNGASAKPVEVDGGISGTGTVGIERSIVLLDGGNTYSGGTVLQFGVLEIGGASAVGTGPITITNAKVMGKETEVLSNPIVTDGNATFLAAHGTTLTLDSAWTVTSAAIIFGSSKGDGTIVLDTLAGSTDGTGVVEIADGTLRAGDSNFQALLDRCALIGNTDIESGGTLDVAGFTSTIYAVAGSGTIENSGALATVTLNGGSFSGTIAGDITLDVSGTLTLAGNAENWSTINVLPTTQLILNGPASANLVLASNDDTINLDDPADFTGSIAGFQAGDQIVLEGVGHKSATFSYSGDTTSGILTVSNALQGVSYNIAFVGDYTASDFFLSGSKGGITRINLYPPASAAASRADSLDFSAAAASHVAADAGIAHLHGGHAASEIALAHDVTDAMHAHSFAFEHFMHDLFVHHATPEALA